MKLICTRTKKSLQYQNKKQTIYELIKSKVKNLQTCRFGLIICRFGEENVEER